MSNFIYPTLTGLSWNVVRTPQWNTGKQKALSGKRSTILYQLYPLIHFELDYELLDDSKATSDLKALVGLFNAVGGSYDTFLFTDPDFNTFAPANAQVFGTGDGSTLTFQLVATYQNAGGPGYAELIQNLNGSPVLYDNGSTISASNYSISGTGGVTFGAGHAPAAGHTLTWSGSFYYRCEFDDDTLDLDKFMNQWWEAKKIAFTSVKL